MSIDHTVHQLLKPQVSLPARLTEAHLQVTNCFQCRKCSGGCPLTFAMDLLPHHVIRLALLGQEDRVFASRTIWVCSGCQTCTTRCPNGIDIAGTMDWLKEEAVKRGHALPDENVAAFHRYFLEGIQAAGGRLPETRLLRRYTLHKLRRQPCLADLKPICVWAGSSGSGGGCTWAARRRCGARPRSTQSSGKLVFRS